MRNRKSRNLVALVVAGLVFASCSGSSDSTSTESVVDSSVARQ